MSRSRKDTYWQVCEECGTRGKIKVRPVPGMYVQCDACRTADVAVGSTVLHPFGRDHMPPPSDLGFAAYRVACYDLGYTLRTAGTRVRREALQQRWSRWCRLIAQYVIGGPELVRAGYGHHIEWQIEPDLREAAWLVKNRDALLRIDSWHTMYQRRSYDEPVYLDPIAYDAVA